jgi:hypothetical protein
MLAVERFRPVPEGEYCVSPPRLFACRKVLDGLAWNIASTTNGLKPMSSMSRRVQDPEETAQRR